MGEVTQERLQWGRPQKRGKRGPSRGGAAKHQIRVDDEVKLVIEDMQHSMRSSTGRECSANRALKVLLSHRQPGGWEGMVTRAAARKDREVTRSEDEKELRRRNA